MQVIAVLNQKGGAGKTTIAVNLARALQLRGKSVVIVDSDPQGTARDHAAVEGSTSPLTVGLDRPTLDRDVRSLAADIVVIDGAPQIATLAASAVKAADFVLIPVQPSPYDIWATADLVDLVKQRQEITEGKLRAAFIVSRAIVNTKLGRDVVGALEEYELPILSTHIHQRVDYPKTAARGMTVLDQRSVSTEAQDEIVSMANEVLAILNEIEREAAA